MKRIRVYISALLISLWPAVLCPEQAPYKIKDQPFINKNFEDIFFTMATHNHGGEDSSQLGDVIPSSHSIYDLGSVQKKWDNVYVSSSVSVEKGTFTATSGSFYTKTSSTGFVAKSENGTCYAIRVHNGGALYSVSITCPN